MSLHTPEQFAEKAAQVLALAKQHGADEASVSLSQSEGISVQTREGKIEELNREQELSIDIEIFKNRAKGHSSLSDWSAQALEAGVKAAINAATYTEPDPHFGLPDPTQYARITAQDYAPLELDSGEIADAPWLEDQAHRMETAAHDADKRIAISEGASAQAGRSYHYYATSNGFAIGSARSRTNLSIAVIARENSDQQSNYAYDTARWRRDLKTAESIGVEAATRAVAMLQPQKIQTGSYPILFAPEMARGLIGHLLSALAGTAQYRKLSFLTDSLGKAALPEWLNLIEYPHLARGLASGLIDADGLPCHQGALIENGIVQHYLLDLYAARRLGQPPTGNAGGARNLRLESKQTHCLSREQLYHEMNKGILITSLMGQGINLLTGDYSRGASGFWIENGTIAYPIDGITIAGNLKDMLKNICAIGNDPDTRSSIQAPSILIEKMTVAR